MPNTLPTLRSLTLVSFALAACDPGVSVVDASGQTQRVPIESLTLHLSLSEEISYDAQGAALAERTVSVEVSAPRQADGVNAPVTLGEDVVLELDVDGQIHPLDLLPPAEDGEESSPLYFASMVFAEGEQLELRLLEKTPEGDFVLDSARITPLHPIGDITPAHGSIVDNTAPLVVQWPPAQTTSQASTRVQLYSEDGCQPELSTQTEDTRVVFLEDELADASCQATLQVLRVRSRPLDRRPVINTLIARARTVRLEIAPPAQDQAKADGGAPAQ